MSIKYVIGYIVSGVLAYGFALAYLQRRCSDDPEGTYETDKFTALLLGYFGYYGLVIFFLASALTTGMIFRNPHEQRKTITGRLPRVWKRKTRHLRVVK